MAASQMQYLPVILLLCVAVCMAFGMLALNFFLGPRVRGEVKNSTFECGSDPIGSSRQRFNVKFYLVAIFFIVFDIEAVFMYPWAGLFREMVVEPGVGWLVVAEMFVFVGILGAGLAYVWRRGALDWE